MVSRYGVKIRKRENAVLVQARAKHTCPTCGKKAVKRVANALWTCRACGAKIAGGAYSLETQVGSSAAKLVQSAKIATKK